jgi:hypothetical protein
MQMFVNVAKSFDGTETKDYIDRRCMQKRRIHCQVIQQVTVSLHTMEAHGARGGIAPTPI